ncbi:hypothetical protein KY348_06780 [Candidatus Woesearchaeota archaeon]|nr:hypothetical protein [Candidatus Woesearchaeota archaeon]
MPRKIPGKLPKDMQIIVNKLKKSRNKEDCLRKAYDILSKKNRGHRLKTYTCLPELFVCNVNKLWKKKGFMHCTNINYLLRILLVKSGFFKEKDIKSKWTLVWYFSPHQYLKIRLNKNKFVYVDIWAKPYGIKFGEYAHGLNIPIFS